MKPIQAGVIVIPSSRGPGHPCHVISLHEDRSATCASCPAAQYAKSCNQERRVTRRARDPRRVFLRDIATVKHQAFTVLYRHGQGAIDSDLTAIRHWLEDWYGYDESTPFFSVLDAWIGSGVGNRLETFRRRCYEWIQQGWFERSPEVAEERRWRERAWREELGYGVGS